MDRRAMLAVARLDRFHAFLVRTHKIYAPPWHILVLVGQQKLGIASEQSFLPMSQLNSPSKLHQIFARKES
jgi:hypothetical protein